MITYLASPNDTVIYEYCRMSAMSVEHQCSSVKFYSV